MKSKKAFLLGEHTINIIFGILAIVVLVFLAIGIFGIFSSNNEAQQAKANLDHIMADISNLEKEGSGTKTRTLASPYGWVLVGWPADLISAPTSILGPSGSGNIPKYGTLNLPNKCSINLWEKCLCICEYVKSESREDLLASCDETGFCKELDNFNSIMINDDFIKIDKPKTLDITLDKQNNKLSIIEKI